METNIVPEADGRNSHDPDKTRTRWSPDELSARLAQEQIVFDHPLWRRAPAISIGAGAAAGLGIVLFAETAWWMPFLAFCVVSAVLFRLLRPRFRHPSIEDEL